MTDGFEELFGFPRPGQSDYDPNGYRIKWRCPLCQEYHEQTWPVPEFECLEMWFFCQRCSHSSKMTWQAGSWRWEGDWR